MSLAELAGYKDSQGQSTRSGKADTLRRSPQCFVQSCGTMRASTSPSKTEYLRTLPSVRAQSTKVFELAKQSKLQYFEYHPEKEADVVKFCADIVTRDFGTNYSSIPRHGRWKHFDTDDSPNRVATLQGLLSKSNPGQKSQTKALIDLFLVSVLLDAGAGPTWKYKEHDTGLVYSRSEGLAVASLDIFKQGIFSSVKEDPYRVDAVGLACLTPDIVSKAMQVSHDNLMDGIEGRTGLLINLAEALKSKKEFFGEDARPGNMLDFLESQTRRDGPKTKLHVFALWNVLISGLASIWPVRTTLAGIPLGDVWPCPALRASLPEDQEDGDDLVPFHKLTQWLTYSLVPVFEQGMGWEVEGLEDMTGLPEYRNGGLLVDFGVLSLTDKAKAEAVKLPTSSLPAFEPFHPAVVEWRAITVIELDRISEAIHDHLGLPKGTLSLAQVLEAATWKGGREIAKQLREGGGPPIEIISDGTVF